MRSKSLNSERLILALDSKPSELYTRYTNLYTKIIRKVFLLKENLDLVFFMPIYNASNISMKVLGAIN